MEFLKDLWKPVYEFLHTHAGTLGFAATWIGIVWVWWRKRSAWARKEFHDQINFSLNYVVGNKFAVRTLVETSTNLVWLNSYGVQRVLTASKSTTPDNPFLTFNDPKDLEFVNRAVTNVLSEKFASVFVAESMGVPVRTTTYVFAVTFERFPDMRTQKFRVLIIEEKLLLDMFGPTGRADQLDVPHPVFKDRIKSLQAMYPRHLESKAKKNSIVDTVSLGVVT